jgi:tetratricopeptide (TPR) repeat protein
MPDYFWFGLFVCLATCGVVIRYAWIMFSRKHEHSAVSWLVFCMLGYLVAVSPMLGIVSFGFQAHADRFTYLPSIFMAAGITGFLYWLSLKKNGFSVMGLGLMAFFCMALCCVSIQQISTWRDTETLSRWALQFEPDNVIAHKNLGAHLFLKRGRQEEAEKHFERAMMLHRDALTYSVGITLFVANGNMTRATAMSEHFIKTVHERENQGWKIHACIAEAFQAYCKGDWALAEENFTVVVQQNPAFAPALFMLGNCALKRGDKSACEKFWNIARRDVMFRSWL